MITVTGLFISILIQGKALFLTRRRQSIRRTDEYIERRIIYFYMLLSEII
jgi:hypothetical protein